MCVCVCVRVSVYVCVHKLYLDWHSSAMEGKRIETSFSFETLITNGKLQQEGKEEKERGMVEGP